MIYPDDFFTNLVSRLSLGINRPNRPFGLREKWVL